MKLLNFVFIAIMAFSSTAWACPDGHYEMCVIPRPFGGCAQKACVPNGGTIVDGASDGLKDLNKGVIRLGNDVINTTEQAGQSLGNVASRIDWNKVQKIDWGTAVWIAAAIVNGAACIASDGVSPGYGVQGSTVACSENACACAAISLAIAVKNRTNMSEEEKGKVDQVVNDPKFAEIMQRSDVVAATSSQLSTIGIRRSLRPHNPPRCPRCIEP